MKKLRLGASAVLSLVALVLAPIAAYAAPNSNLTQTINPGTLTTDILDSTRTPVASPTAAMTAANFSFDCQTVTGTLGSSTQRLYVTDPSATASNQSWSLSIAATGGAATKWQNTGNTKNYSYNDPTVANSIPGCATGQLTVNPAAATVTADCVSSACTSVVINKGTSTAMTTSTPVTLMSSPVGATLWRGYLTGIGLSQVIPAEQAADSYTLPMTLTVVAA